MTAKPRPRSEQAVLRDYLVTILVAVSFSLIIRFFIIEAYRIPTTAMRPTIEAGDTIFVGKWQFGLRLPLLKKKLSTGRKPLRGEVILYVPPEDPKRELIKRVIGLPGETIQIKQSRVLLNGQAVEVTLSRNASCGIEKIPGAGEHGACWEPPSLEDFGPTQIPQDSLFVLSDMRTGLSTEGNKNRVYSIVPISAVQGLALWTWLSIQPQTLGQTGWFPQFRFERMFRRINSW